MSREVAIAGKEPLLAGVVQAPPRCRCGRVPPQQVDDLHRNRWTGSTGMGGRFESERVDDFTRNTHDAVEIVVLHARTLTRRGTSPVAAGPHLQECMVLVDPDTVLFGKGRATMVRRGNPPTLRASFDLLAQVYGPAYQRLTQSENPRP